MGRRGNGWVHRSPPVTSASPCERSTGWIDQGEIPAFQLGRVIRLPRHELDEYLERSRIQQGDIAGRHRDVDKARWRWGEGQLRRDMRERLDAFVCACQAGGSTCCPLCEEAVEAADVVDHMLEHVDPPRLDAGRRRSS